MPRTIVEPYPHDIAVKTALETLGRPVGFADHPAGALDGVLNRTGPDYFVIYPIPGGFRDGAIGDPYADVELVYRLHIVGRTGLGVRVLEGDVEAALLGVAITGRRVLTVELDFGDVQPDRDVGPPHPFLATPTVRLWTTPSP